MIMVVVEVVGVGLGKG